MLQPTSAFLFFLHKCFIQVSFAPCIFFFFFLNNRGPLLLLGVHFFKYINIYHLGHTNAGSPNALTQGMNNISCKSLTRKLSSSLYHMNLIGGLQSKQLSYPGKVGCSYASDRLLSLTPAPVQAFFVPHHHFFISPLNFTVIYQGLKAHHAVSHQLHAIVLSMFESKVSCVVVLPQPGAIKNYDYFFLFNNMLALWRSGHGPQTGSHDTLLQSWADHHQQAEIFTLRTAILAACSDVKHPP